MNVEQTEPVESPLITDHGDTRISEMGTDDGVSELQRHKEARGLVEKPKAEPKAEEPEPSVEAKPEEPQKPQKWSDPDTGDTYDMRHKVARRIKAVLEDRGKTRAELESANRRIDELTRMLVERGATPKQAEAQATAQVKHEDAEPDPNDTAKYPEGQFDRAYLRDMSRWTAKQVTQEALSEAQQRAVYAQRQQAETATIQRWQGTVAEAKKRYPDFEQVLERIPTTPENEPIVDIMMTSPVGNDVVYVMGTNEQAQQAYAMARTPQDRLRVLHHVEAQLIVAKRHAAAQAKAGQTRAPSPTSPVHTGAGPSGPMDWSKDDPDQLSRWKAMRRSSR